MTTLDDLKRAIELVYISEVGKEFVDHRADAWRAAFEWREGWRQRSHEITPQSVQWSAHCEEGDEGMARIREHLK